MNQNPIKLSASLEDYLEAIYLLSQKGKVARSKDIAQMLNVARPSVTGALRTLTNKNLIHYKPYGFISLTEKGHRLAVQVVQRHDALKTFLVDILGVDAQTAQQTACLAEHAFRGQVICRLKAYLEFLSKTDCAQKFQRYYQQTFLKDKPQIP